MVIKTNFRHGSNDFLGIIAGPSEYVKGNIDGEIRLEKIHGIFRRLETATLERLLWLKKWPSV